MEQNFNLMIVQQNYKPLLMIYKIHYLNKEGLIFLYY
jgi:hypothetical protein